MQTLNQLATTISSDLDLEGIVQRVTDMATRLTGAKYGAFFYNVTHRGKESYLLFTLVGRTARSLREVRAAARNGGLRPDLPRHRSGALRRHPRRPALRQESDRIAACREGHLPVVSYLAVPVISRSGEVIGGLFFAHDKPGVFTQDTEDIAVAIAAHAAVAIDNARLYATAQEEMKSKELLLNEFKHRMKNTLSTVQAIAGQTLRKSHKDEREIFIGRLHALAYAHEALTGAGMGPGISKGTGSNGLSHRLRRSGSSCKARTHRLTATTRCI